MRILKKELWPVKILIPKDVSDNCHYHIEIWLGENMGVFKGRRWHQIACSKGVHYYFRDRKDATFFALRWA